MPDDDVQQPAAPPPAAAPPPPPAWYAQRRRRWPWVAVPVAVVVLAAGGFLVQHRLATTTGGPATTSGLPAIVPAAPGEQPGFALAGAGDAVVFLQTGTAVQRADLASGATALTPTPRLEEPSSFFAGPGWVASKTFDSPSGFLVSDRAGAQVLPVALQQAGRAYPAVADGGIWVLPGQADRSGARTAVKVGVTGERIGGTSIRVPAELGLPVGNLSDSLLAVSADGTFEVGPVRPRRLSRGTLLGIGTTAVVTWDCAANKKCGDARIDRPGKVPQQLPAVRRSLQGLYDQDVTTAAAGRGALSPDGRWVALELPKPTRSGARLVLVDLTSGHRVEVPGALAGANGADQAAWTPNSRYLLALTDGRLRAVDRQTDKVVTIGGTPSGLLHLTIPGTATM